MTGAADIAPTTPDKLCSACDKDAHVSSSEVPPAADEAQRRIKELEAQVQSLTDGASRTGISFSFSFSFPLYSTLPIYIYNMIFS